MMSFSDSTVGTIVGKKKVSAASASVIAAGDVTLLIDSGAVHRDVEITVIATTKEHSGRIPAHLENLTEGGAVYRMLPDGQHFDKEITLAMRYDSSALPYGYTSDDIYTFFYNEELRMWQQIARDSVDTQNQIVYSRTDHFTDYINGVLKVPENSDAISYTPTTIRELKASDPLEGITLIAPPEANQQGTANLTYPLTLPAGRHGMQPQLAITYSSGGGSGILGLGWSLPISEISVETRWGVPLYDSGYETENYLLDGTSLVTSYRDTNHNLRLNKPVYHREYEPRSTADSLQFYPRVEGAFRKIERYGGSPRDYYWVVTDKDGTRHYYGLTKQSTLRDHSQNIAKWMLEKSVDTYGNTVTYYYTTKFQGRANTPSAKQLCLDCIRYTGKENTPDQGQYIVRLTYGSKRDRGTSFRYGLEELDSVLLDRVEVLFRDTIVREYYFGYRQGVFGKTLLCKIFEGYDDSARYQRYTVSNQDSTIRELSPYNRCSATIDKDMYLHITHSFDYYDLDHHELFKQGVPLEHEGTDNARVYDYLDSILLERRNISGSGSSGWNIYGALDVGGDYSTWLKTLSAGGHYTYTNDYSDGFLQLVDIDGDGYPDKLYKSLSGDLMCRPQIPGENRFGLPVPIRNPRRFQFTSSSSQSYGWEASSLFKGVGKSWSDGRSTTSTYLSDVNADGMADIVDNGSVYINRGNFRFDDVTRNDTLRVGGTCSDDVIDFSGEIDPTIFDDGYHVVERIVCRTYYDTVRRYDLVYNTDGTFDTVRCEAPTVYVRDTCWTVRETVYYAYPRRYEPDVDLVRMWKAPYAGRVRVTGRAMLSADLRNFRAMTRTDDGVDVAIQVAGETTPRLTKTVLPESPQTMNCVVDVSVGDTLFFRIGAADKRLYDVVEWTPLIEYQAATHRNGMAASPLTRTDANGDYMYRFDYATDFMLTERQSVSAGSDSGTLCSNDYSVVCHIKALQPLSQEMIYTLVKSNIDNTGTEQQLNQATFAIGTMPDQTVTWTASHIQSNEKLVLRLAPVGGGQMNWSDIETEATVTMTYSTNATVNARLADADACKAYIYHPVVERRFFDYLVFPSETVTGLTGSPSIQVDVNSAIPFGGRLYMTVKDYANSICYQTPVAFTNGTALINTAPFSFPAGGGYQYQVDLYTANPLVAAVIDRILVRFDNGAPHDAGLYTKYGADSLKHHGTLYRGWGQFGYKPSGTGAEVVSSDRIQADSYYTDTSSVPRPSDDDVDNYDVSEMNPDGSPEEEPSGFGYNPLSGSFYEMHADGMKPRWKSYANLVTASRTISSLDNSDPAVENGQLPTEDMYQSPVPVVMPGEKMKAVNKHVMNKGNGYTKKQITQSEGYSRQLGDFMDLNGDRYPDNVSEIAVQYSKAQGGLGDMKQSYCAGNGINRSTNTTTGETFNGTFLRITNEPGNDPKKSRKAAMVSGMFQILNYFNPTTGNDVTQNTFMDVNADGLPDIVYNGDSVRYNMGYRFTTTRHLPVGRIRSSRSEIRSAGYGFNVRNTSISGSISRNRSDNTTSFALMDINGDGLPDAVSPSVIEINLGDGTYQPFNFAGSGDGKIDNSTSTGFSLGATATYGIPIPIPFFPLKVGFSFGLGGTASFNRSGAEFVDMDNDGCPDYVYCDGNNIMVCYSNIGRTNLLRSVSNFAGAEYQIGYSLSVSTIHCPQRHWVMDTLTVYDGHDGDGASMQYRRFAYSNRYYDRFERDDYGYSTVNTYEYASLADFTNGNVYRTTTQEFYNSDYYHARLKWRERIAKDSKYMETVYSYADAAIEDGHYLGGDTPAWCEGDGWPAVATEETHLFEGSGNSINTRREYYYGAYGNVIRLEDLGDLADAFDDYTVNISYSLNAQRYFVANVSELDIPGYRNRKATYYSATGSLRTLTVENTPGSSSVFEYLYDSYGNDSIVTTPATRPGTNVKYTIDYRYDPMTHTLPVRIHNNMGYTSWAGYSLRWQLPLWTVDIGGDTMRYKYDSHGHADTIIGPKELAQNHPYTVRHAYWYNQKFLSTGTPYYNTNRKCLNYAWGRTWNRDPADAHNDIETVTFSDGLGRIIQVKKDIDENGTEVRAVGGTVHYDAMGRKVREYYPHSETLTLSILTLNSAVTSEAYSQMQYDYLDRPVRVDYPDGTYSTNAYSVANDANLIPRLRTSATDRNGHTSYIYTDPRRLTVQVTDALNNTTKFHYDPVGQLASTTDPEGNITTHTYDLGGRHVQRTHPAAGTTTWSYDAAGNLTGVTQNSGAQVTYSYEYMRLKQVSYANQPWNNVYYEYGAANTGRGAGRVVRQQDASGVQTFRYDCMGNVEYNLHTYVQPNATGNFTLATRWVYDSWGRVDTIVYPDREVVKYRYDHGGNVRQIEGHKPGQSATTYMEEILYDRFGQRTQQRDGSGVTTYYAYDPLSRRLTRLLDNPSQQTMPLQNNRYSYDNEGNVTQIVDYGLNNRTQTFTYDNIDRLTASTGIRLNGAQSYTATYSYSSAGRLTAKNVASHRLNTAGSYAVNYQNHYVYPPSGNVFAPGAVQEALGNSTTSLTWDADGNLTRAYRNNPDEDRRMCWTEDNRMQAYWQYARAGGGIAAYYNYNGAGERNLKLATKHIGAGPQAADSLQNPPLAIPTLYASALVTLTKEGYTKHYFEGERRICSTLGGGFGNVGWNVTDTLLPPICAEDYSVLYGQQQAGVQSAFSGCFQTTPQLVATHDLRQMLDQHERNRNDAEATFYYHSDHLGSMAYLTDNNGNVTQTLNYLPYGEDWVDVRNNLDSRLGAYTFNGKEKDYESGFHYYGERYYWSELLTGWLSVDPMADKYPSISPYAYCAWNPVKLVDPDGRDWYEYVHPETHKTMVRWTESHNQDELNNELKGGGIKGNYLGVTAETATKYFGLMGDIVDKNEKQGEHYRMVKDLDRAIIYRSMGGAFDSKTANFSDVFPFEKGGTNTRLGYSYAGGEAGISMNGKQEDGKRVGMEGRFNEMRKDDGRSLRSYGMLPSLDAPRFSINGARLEHHPEIAAISFARDPSKADVFQQRYEGLKGRPLYHAQRTGQGWKKTKYR